MLYRALDAAFEQLIDDRSSLDETEQSAIRQKLARALVRGL